MDLALTPADGDQATAFVAVEVHRCDFHIHADHPATEREAGVVLEHLPERPQLLVLAVGIDDDLLDQVVDRVTHGPTLMPRFFPEAPIRVAWVRGESPGQWRRCRDRFSPCSPVVRVDEVLPETDIARVRCWVERRNDRLAERARGGTFWADGTSTGSRLVRR